MRDRDYIRLADFRRSLRAFLAFSKEAAAKAGLAPQQYQAMLAIRARTGGGLAYGVGDLAKELFIRHNTAVELVDRLEAQGLVQRRAEGARAALSLTEQGRAKLEQLAATHLEELNRSAPLMAHILTGRGDPGAR